MEDKILITGISGNVGNAVYMYLKEQAVNLIAGVRNIDKYKKKYPDVTLRHLDMNDPSTYNLLLKDIDKVFLVRPPQLTDVEMIFRPFIDSCKKNGVKHIVFLSLIGIEKNPFPPHHKIEKLIIQSGINYTFIRPSFFMQNLLDAHGDEIKHMNQIFIPSGNAKINFVDARDIGEICARVMLDDKYYNQAYDITGVEILTYTQIASIMSHVLERNIVYSKPSMIKFRRFMIKKGIEKQYVTVMMMLYMTTRFGMANVSSSDAEMILERSPRKIEEFINDYKEEWI